MINLCGDRPLWTTHQESVQERKFAIFLNFICEFEAGVYLGEAGRKFNMGIFGRVLSEDAEGVVHIHLKVSGD